MVSTHHSNDFCPNVTEIRPVSPSIIAYYDKLRSSYTAIGLEAWTELTTTPHSTVRYTQTHRVTEGTGDVVPWRCRTTKKEMSSRRCRPVEIILPIK